MFFISLEMSNILTDNIVNWVKIVLLVEWTDLAKISACQRFSRDKTLSDKSIYISTKDTQNYPLCRYN